MTTKAVDPLHTRNGSAVEQNAGLIQVRLRLSGITPLLINALGEDQLLAIRDKTKKAKNAAKPSVRDEADGKVYRLKSGDPHVPVRLLMSNFIAAGQFVRLDGKRQISTADKTILPGMLTILSHECPLVNEHDKPAKWEVDIQQGRNPNGGEAVCIVRPRFDDWHLEVEIEVDQAQMPLTMARDLVDIAGSRCGLGDFRPQRKGTYGRYKVAIWEVIR
jgi:hypothetical protein